MDITLIPIERRALFADMALATINSRAGRHSHGPAGDAVAEFPEVGIKFLMRGMKSQALHVMTKAIYIDRMMVQVESVELGQALAAYSIDLRQRYYDRMIELLAAWEDATKAGADQVKAMEANTQAAYRSAPWGKNDYVVAFPNPERVEQSLAKLGEAIGFLHPEMCDVIHLLSTTE